MALPEDDPTLAGALARSESWASLMQRLEASRSRLRAVLPLLPEAMHAGVRAGPLDDASWVLLVEHAAHAAKLRQLLPALDQALQAAGFAPRTLRIRIQPRAGNGG